MVLPACGPGGGDEGRFEPYTALAHAGAPAFASAFIIARTEARPEDQVGGIGEARRVGTDLGRRDLVWTRLVGTRHKLPEGAAVRFIRERW